MSIVWIMAPRGSFIGGVLLVAGDSGVLVVSGVGGTRDESEEGWSSGVVVVPA